MMFVCVCDRLDLSSYNYTTRIGHDGCCAFIYMTGIPPRSVIPRKVLQPCCHSGATFSPRYIPIPSSTVELAGVRTHSTSSTKSPYAGVREPARTRHSGQGWLNGRPRQKFHSLALIKNTYRKQIFLFSSFLNLYTEAARTAVHIILANILM